MVEDKKLRIGVIGAGAMGGATALGLAERGYDVMAATPHPSKCGALKEAGVVVTHDNTEVARLCDIIIIAVKPWVLPVVAEQLKEPLSGCRIQIGVIAAGIPCSEIRSMFPTVDAGSDIALIMPNTAMAVGKSVTFTVPILGEAEVFNRLYRNLGTVMEIGERQLPGATSLASCGIAYAMRYVRAAVEGGVELGFKAQEAQEIVAGTLEGASALLREPGAHAEAEIDKVTTPGGKTIRGLNRMEACGFTTAVIEGLKASL